MSEKKELNAFQKERYFKVITKNTQSFLKKNVTKFPDYQQGSFVAFIIFTTICEMIYKYSPEVFFKFIQSFAENVCKMELTFKPIDNKPCPESKEEKENENEKEEPEPSPFFDNSGDDIKQ